MFIDLQSRFSGSTTAAGVTTGDAVTVTAISSNVMDLRSTGTTGPTLVDEGIEITDMWLIVQTDSSADWTSGGATTLTITLESDTVAGLSSTPAVHFSTTAIPKASLLKSTRLVAAALPSADYQRFLGTRYTVATGPFTAGAILAYLTPVPQRNKTYPVGFAVS